MTNIHRVIWDKFGIHRSNAMPLNGAPWHMDKTRAHLGELFKDLGYKIGAEIGVEKGKYSRFLCDINPELKLYCIDPWRAYARNSQEREDVIYEKAKAHLKDKNVEIMRMTSLEASQVIADGSLDFVYIDSLHEFDPFMMDIILWVPKVRKDGIVSGHDFAHFHEMGIVQAVTAYVTAHSIIPWYITTGEVTPSWFWVKT